MPIIMAQHALDNPSDHDLSDRLGEGDHAAFEAIFRRYRMLLLSDVRRLMPSFDSHTIDDVVQHVFVRLWQHRHRFSRVPSLKTILRKLARDHAVDTLRQRSRTNHVPLHPNLCCDQAPPLARMQQDELLAQIERACATLTDAQRTALELKLSGLSACEVAKQVGCSAKAAERRESSARMHLRKHLSPRDCDA